VNIPKKYGGQLDFEFGGYPILDPALKEVTEFQGQHTDFPHGPMFWINGDEGKKAAIAVGSVNEKERREKVATIYTKNTQRDVMNLDDTAVTNGQPKASEKVPGTGSEFLAVPNATAAAASVPAEPTSQETSQGQENGVAPIVALEAGGEAVPQVQQGEVVPATRPEPVNFVTASEGIQTLSLKENDSTSEPSANGAHETATANLLDPAINVTGPTEDTH
jgi:hypothetical protein